MIFAGGMWEKQVQNHRYQASKTDTFQLNPKERHSEAAKTKDQDQGHNHQIAGFQHINLHFDQRIEANHRNRAKQQHHNSPHHWGGDSCQKTAHFTDKSHANSGKRCPGHNRWIIGFGQDHRSGHFGVSSNGGGSKPISLTDEVSLLKTVVDVMKILNSVEFSQNLIDIMLGELSEELIDEILFNYQYRELDNSNIRVVMQNRIAKHLPFVGKAFDYKTLSADQIKDIISEDIRIIRELTQPSYT